MNASRVGERREKETWRKKSVEMPDISIVFSSDNHRG
jgi:hypothetical protein